jgi:hypothetical protein
MEQLRKVLFPGVPTIRINNKYTLQSNPRSVSSSSVESSM